MAFHVGQKVTLKNDEPWIRDANEICPAFGEVYTIHEIIACSESAIGFGLGLVEIRNTPHDYEGLGFRETVFPAEEFRPVVERKTDISIFTAMLTPKPSKARKKERA